MVLRPSELERLLRSTDHLPGSVLHLRLNTVLRRRSGPPLRLSMELRVVLRGSVVLLLPSTVFLVLLPEAVPLGSEPAHLPASTEFPLLSMVLPAPLRDSAVPTGTVVPRLASTAFLEVRPVTVDYHRASTAHLLLNTVLLPPSTVPRDVTDTLKAVRVVTHRVVTHRAVTPKVDMLADKVDMLVDKVDMLEDKVVTEA